MADLRLSDSSFFTLPYREGHWQSPNDNVKALMRRIENGMHPFRAVNEVFLPTLGARSYFMPGAGANIHRDFKRHNFGGFERVIEFCEGVSIHPVFLAPPSASFLPDALIETHAHIIRNKSGKYSSKDQFVSIGALALEYQKTLTSRNGPIKDRMLCDEIDHQCDIAQQVAEKEDSFKGFDCLDVRLRVAQAGILRTLRDEEKPAARLRTKQSQTARRARQSLKDLFVDPLKVSDIFERAAQDATKRGQPAQLKVEALMRDPDAHRTIIGALKPGVRRYYAWQPLYLSPLEKRITDVLEHWRASAVLESRIRSDADFREDLSRWLSRIEDYLKLLDKKPHDVPDFLRLYMNKIRIDGLIEQGIVPKYVADQSPTPRIEDKGYVTTKVIRAPN